ncbi:MAG: M42 family metallopeptidase [Chloroflexota bacterium]
MTNSTHLDKKQITLLGKLCQAMALSGDEGEVRSIILEEIRSYVTNFKVDTLGNLLAFKKGTSKKPLKVMLAAHMDEIGFMIAADDGDGLFRFETSGGIDLRQLPGKAVIVGKEHIPGVIGARPIHLTTSSDRRDKISLEKLRIDIGPGSNKIKPGDRAVFATRFQHVGTSLIGKALDDRLGVAVLIEIMKQAPANIDLQVAFTVQEETGLRGAKVAAYYFNPDLAFVVDSTPANDLPTWDDEDNTSYNCHLGAGPAIYIADGATLSDPRLIRHLVETCEKEGIPYQYRQPGGGGTDAGAIHKQRAGIPSVSISIPGRYPHTAAGMARISDFNNTISLLKATLQSIPLDILTQERK